MRQGLVLRALIDLAGAGRILSVISLELLHRTQEGALSSGTKKRLLLHLHKKHLFKCRRAWVDVCCGRPMELPLAAQLPI